MDLSVEYLGHKLKNPIIVGSCGLTSSVSKLKSLEKAGAAAVVLKSLFEEQIDQEYWQEQSKNTFDFPDVANYINAYSNDKSFEKYLDLIKSAKENISIPVFASINCHSAGNWIDYAKKMEEAGADAIELNVSLLPNDFDATSADNEKFYFEITKKVKKAVSIPVALKMSSYSAGLAKLIKELSWTKNVDSFVLFNRYFRPDIDLDTLELKSGGLLSNSGDLAESLRWVLLLSKTVKTDIIGNTGIHTGKDVVKQILAGAKAVQVVSAIYINGEEHITGMLKEIEDWMESKKFNSLDDFRGTLHKKEELKKGFERIQFMKYYGSIE
ncbi:MAG: dihydroorotate dehydrogenase-like protein [Flavobacteriales bacterium]|nr:dihydroorotate dehydrogenase-like protein [Flavobacteriales bacterium]